MLIFDFYINILKNETGITIGHPEYDGISKSIKEAIMSRNFMELYARDGIFAGVLTWELRKSKENPSMIDLGITNLLILKRAAGTYCLQRATNRLRKMYPNCASFVWKNRKTGKLVVRRQERLHGVNCTAV